MCGRYTLRRADRLKAMFDAAITPTFEEFSEHGPRFNLAPTQLMPVVRLNREGKRALSSIAWGLIPSWNKAAPKLKPINARAETILTSNMYKAAMQRRRCLVPADGFYEWQGEKPPKQPFFIHRPDDGLFAFAGLWERWKPSPDAPTEDTFTIITTTANDQMRPIHQRMPVMLHEADFDRWLNPDNDGPAVVALLKPYDEALETYPISTKVNNVKNDDPSLITGEG